MRFDPVGVVGAGVMGSGVAQNLAQTGHQVVLVDVAPEPLERARREIRQSLRMGALFGQKVAGGEGADAVLGRIRFTTDYQDLAPVQFLVENVVEKWPVKEAVYRQIDGLCDPACVFAANTSCVSITKLGAVTRRPDRVVGMHFMNPVPLKPVVEVIRGHHTSEDTLERARAFLAAMGKEAIVVNDLPGFVSNRVLMLTINEAVWLVQDGVAPAEDIDRLFTTCFGHKMGPLATGDLIGLDTILYSLEVLYESYNDGKFRPCPLLRKMVDAGLHGRKTGQGFFDYGAGS
jgi:3-hydroxybutyryl-CoA dehydrogenase